MPKPRRQAKPAPRAAEISEVSTARNSGWFRMRNQAILALAFVMLVKSIVLMQLGDHVLLRPGGSPDSIVYVNLATRVTSGQWSLAPGLYFVSPLYIYFLAAILGATGSLLVAKVVQILL